MILNPNSEPF